jgi:hypothetical protein
MDPTLSTIFVLAVLLFGYLGIQAYNRREGSPKCLAGHRTLGIDTTDPATGVTRRVCPKCGSAMQGWGQPVSYRLRAPQLERPRDHPRRSTRRTSSETDR